MDRSKWEYKKLGEVATFLNGYAFKPENWSKHGLKIIRIQNLTDATASYNCFDGDIDPKYIVRNGDLLISWSATLGAFLWDNDDALLNQHIFKTIFDKSDIDKYYLKYCVISKLEEMAKKSHGVTMRHITKKDFDNTIIPYPSISDQQRIVAELDCLNEMIAVKQEQLKEFDKLAQSIFYDMFGKGCSQQQWEYTTIGNISEEVKYGTSSPATPNGRYKYLRMNNMTNDGYLDLSDLKYIDVAANDYEKYVVRKGDVLFNRTNSRELVGKTALFNYDEEMIIAGYIIRVRLKTTADPCFVVRYMNLPEQKDYLRGLCRGAIGQANINAKELQAIPIPLPPLALQQQFAEKIQAIEAQKELVKQSIAETQALLDYTMDKYFG